jgi:thiamine biosynthesis protein ThiS
MKITVTVGKERSIVDVEENITINDLLEQLDINRETVLVRLNGMICTEEETLQHDDFVEIIRAVSGG